MRPPWGARGRVVDDLVEHIDIPATIRELAGAVPPAGSSGCSLLPYLSGDAQPVRREVVHSENYGFAAFVTDRYKLVVHEATVVPCQLFDLEVDPGEDRNVVAEPAYRDILDDLTRRHVQPYFATPPTVLPAMVPDARR